MKEIVYTDGVANISLAAGMIRLDMFHYAGQPAPGERELPRKVDQQLVMPPAAFMRAFETMQQFIDELEKKGIVHHITPVHDHTHHVSSSPNFE